MSNKLIFTDRLDFRLPEFTRISWVSEKARDIWEPRISEISQIWKELEWRSVLENIRPCSITRHTLDSITRESSIYAENELCLLPIDIAESPSRTSYLKSPQTKSSGQLVVAIGKDIRILAKLKKAWQKRDHDQVGEFLGYPHCCRQFFHNVWKENNCIDTTWPMAKNTAEGDKHIEIEAEGSCLPNILWRWIGIGTVPHLPCSFNCELTIKFAENFLEVARQANYHKIIEWTLEILSWPVEWSSLHGIAEIKTPILRISTSTDACKTKYVVWWKGKKYPIEGARSFKFPYQAPDFAEIIKANDLKRIKRPINKSEEYPDWYYKDNGFSTRAAMDKLHSPLVALAQRKLRGDGLERVIDLGCGNGALLKKICQGYRVIPFGIDVNMTCIQHAKELLSNFSDNFVQGNFFNPELWPHTIKFDLGIIMIGRILEAKDEEKEVLKRTLQSRCNTILTYAYPGYSEKSFSDLINQASMQLTDNESTYAGIATFF